MADPTFAGLDDAVGDVLHQNQQNTAIQVRNNIVTATGTSPDKEAEYKHLARFVGVPTDTVRADPLAIQQQANAQRVGADRLSTDYPHLAQFLTDTDNARIIHDDVPATAAVEQQVKTLPAPPPTAQPPSIGETAGDYGLAAVQGLGGAFNKAAASAGMVVGGAASLYDKAASLITGQQTTAAGDAAFRSFVDPNLANAPAFALKPTASFGQKAVNATTNLVGMLSQITLGGTAGEAPAAAATVSALVKGAVEHGTKAMLFPALSDAVDTGRKVYAETGDGAAAARAAQAQYATSTIGGIVPLNAPGGVLTRLATGALSGAATGEVSHQVMNLAMPGTMQQPDLTGEDRALNALTGSILGGVMGPHAEPNYHEAIRQAYTDASKADAAQQTGDMIAALGQVSAASKLRDRDPQAFRDFVQNVTEDGHLQDVYVDAKTLDEAFAQSGVTRADLDATIPEVAQQLHEALQTNGDVRIPVADYATHIAGGPIDQTILPHLKAEPDGMTYKEGQDYQANQAEEMKATVDKIAAAKTEDDAQQAESQGVYDHVLDQLTAVNRFPADVNKAYAAMTRDFYTTQAERAGMTPAEMLAQHPLNIKAENIAGEGLSQGQRGAYNPETNTIALLKGADLTSFLHEGGHFFLDTMGNMAAHPDAPEGIKSDMQTLLDHFGVKDLDAWHGMTLEQQRESHETFARGFEKYLMEGKAPSVELQSLFSRFRSWLVNVYKSLTSLNVELTPQVRGVMDRMLATDEAIRQAEQVRGYAPLFESAESAGMTPEDFAAYQRTGADATAEASSELEAKSMRDMRWLAGAKEKMVKGINKTAVEARKAIKAEVTKEVEAQPVFQAKEELRTNKALDPALVAEMYGFADKAAMDDAIAQAGKKKELIESLTDQRMLERHGELTDPQSIERLAEAAIHNEARARFIATELKALSKALGPARALAEAAKSAAEASIAAKRIRDIRPAQYTAAEARAARNAEKALAKADTLAAANEKRAQLLNNRLAKTATDAITEINKAVNYLKKFDKPSIRDKIELEYRDQIDALLDRFDLRTSTTATELNKREALLAFVERMAANGYEPQVPEKLLDEAQRQHYKDMKVEDFRGLVDAVKSIEHLGRLKQTLLDGKEARDIADLAKEVKDTTAKLPQSEAASNRGLSFMEAKWLDAKAAGRSMTAALLKMEQMMDWLDNRNTNGALNRVVFRRIADAGVKEYDLQAKVKGELDKLMETHLQDVTKEKGVIYTADGLIDGLTGKPQRFTKKEMLALAGNMGNDSNLAKLAAGEKWDPNQVWSFLHKNMSKADWDFVAGLGRTLEGLWPEKLEMSRRLGNTNPEKIAPRPFDTPHGRYDGWYWPMVYDPARAQDVADRGAKSADALFENTYARANTDTGRTNTRNENYARPVLLSLDVIPRVIKDEIHDIAYREAIIDADKFLSDKTVRNSIVSALSQEHYDQLRPWLQSIANDRKVDMQALKWFDRVAHGARTRATIVGLGYRISTMLVHGSSAAMESIAELGPKWMGKGMADFTNPTQWAANKEFVFARSGEMRNRMNEVDRDVREHIREIDLRLMDSTTGAIARGVDTIKAHAYQGIAMLDMASALPTWMGAYHRGMASERDGGMGLSEQDAVYYADKTVRNAHGGTGIKDLAAVQRGPEFFKLFTMFYTFWNHNVNRLMDTARRAKALPDTFRNGAPGQFSGDLGTVVMRSLVYTLGVQAMHSMLHPKKDAEGDTNWLAWAAQEFTAAAFAGIPILRDVSAHYLTGKDYSATPAASMVGAVGQSGMDAMNAATGEDAHPKWLKHTITTAGYVFGLPLGQPASAVQFLWDVAQGSQDPQTSGDWLRGVLHGEMKAH